MTYDEVASKLQALRANLEKLDRIPQATYEEFSADFRNVAAAIYLLQTSIQVLIDLASWLLARLALGAPRRSIEAFQLLEDAGRLPEGTARRMAAVVGFRNRVVHLYDRVDDQVVYGILVQHKRDLPELFDLLLVASADDGDGSSGGGETAPE